MSNPFEAPKHDTLADAFPNIDPEIIEDILASANDDLEQAFDIMLKMSDPHAQSSTMHRSTAASPPPPLPERRSPQPASTVSDSTNPFLNGTGGGTTRARQDLAQWRQELALRSKQKQQMKRIQRPGIHYNSSASSSSLTSAMPQDWTAYDRNRYIRDAVEAGTASVRKAASFYNQAMTGAHQTMRSATSSGALARPHTARRSTSAWSLPASSTATHATHIPTSQPATSRISAPRSARTPGLSTVPPPQQQQQQQQQPRRTNRTIRPLPPTPAAMQNTATGDTPFSAADEPPPPAYEAHYRDIYVDPQDVDRVLRTHPQQTN